MTDPQGPEGRQGEGEAPKLIIDSDWKSQAQNEKERLAQQEQARKAQAAGAPGAGGAGQGEEPPPADFIELVRMLTTQALLYMGAIPDPSTGKAVLALDIAKYHIDLLTTLEEKTKGNLSEEESTTLAQTAHELRLEFVHMSKALAQAIQEGKIRPQQAGAQGIVGGAGGIGGQ
jgi:hypothetical protein